MTLPSTKRTAEPRPGPGRVLVRKTLSSGVPNSLGRSGNFDLVRKCRHSRNCENTGSKYLQSAPRFDIISRLTDTGGFIRPSPGLIRCVGTPHAPREFRRESVTEYEELPMKPRRGGATGACARRLQGASSSHGCFRTNRGGS